MARMVIKCVYGRLKGRFGALKRDMDINSTYLHCVIYACFVLHNFVEFKMNASMEKQLVKRMTRMPLIMGNRHAFLINEEFDGERVQNISMKYFQ